MMSGLPIMMPAWAEMLLLSLACLILLVDVFLPQRHKPLVYLFTLLALLACAATTALVLTTTQARPVTTFNGMFISDMMGNLLKIFTYLAVACCLIYSRSYLAERALLRGEYFVLMLFATLGMLVMISAGHYISLYMGLELLSLSLYSMVALNRDSAASTEAAMKYFVLGALASGLLLYGLSMIYGATGSLDMAQVAQRSREIVDGVGGDFGDRRRILTFGLVFVVAGLAFKLGVVPFHMWIPDVYHGAPTAVTLFIGSAPKLAAFAMAMRLLPGSLQPLAERWSDATGWHGAGDWQDMLVILAVLSLAVGNLAAIAQTNIKRMLAYSTISHMGFMLLGLLSGVVDGNTRTAMQAWGGAMYYSVVYVLMSLGAFGTVLLLSRAGHEADAIDDMRGLSTRHPWFAFVLLLLMFSMAGVPPTVGFYAKLAVLQPVITAGYIWLAAVAVMFSLIGAFYYLRIVKLMYFDEPRDTAPLRPNDDMALVLSINGLMVLLLGLFPQQLLDLCMRAVRLSFPGTGI